MNREAFFARVRASTVLFAGHMDQGQVDGINAILDEWDKRKLPDVRWLAYMLATPFHETGRTMQPIAEFGGARQSYAPYYGRGLVQLTWRSNYAKASTIVGVDLVANPDKAMELTIAVLILFDGMIKGWFTGDRLQDFIDGAKCDYVNARHVVNGSDKAMLIAGYAVAFQRAIEAAEPSAATLQPPLPATAPTVTPTPAEVIPLPRQPDDPGVETHPPVSPSTASTTKGTLMASVFATLFPLLNIFGSYIVAAGAIVHAFQTGDFNSAGLGVLALVNGAGAHADAAAKPAAK